MSERLSELMEKRARCRRDMERGERELVAIAAEIAAELLAQQRRPLAPRERQVLPLILEGLQNKEIAARLGISPRTAKFHVSNILAKAGCANRGELMAGKWKATETS